jgi:tripartite ATP-independent transporter DctM subunit
MVPFVLALGGLSFILVTGDMPMLAIPAAFEGGIASFVLLAIPFFLVAGVLMEYTGMASRLVDLLDAWVGHWPGGLFVTEILAMYIVSGMSGSKTADIATVGSVMRTPLRERGYSPAEFVAVLSAGAAMGETVPPSLAMLILCSITTISIGALFLAGIAPAALLALAMIAGVMFRGRGGRFPRGRPFNLRHGLLTVPGAIPALLVPVIVIGGIVGGVATPTEASSFAVVYGLLAAVFFYRSVNSAVFWARLRESSLIGGIVLLILSAANLMTQTIVMDRLPQHLGKLLTSAGGKDTFLFIVGAGLIVLGIVLEGLPALIIFGPLLLPVAVNLGVHPIHFGIVIIIAMGVGVFSPPLGMGYYQACIIGGARTEDAFKPGLFYTAMLAVGLVFVIMCPEVTLMVPRYFGMVH